MTYETHSPFHSLYRRLRALPGHHHGGPGRGGGGFMGGRGWGRGGDGFRTGRKLGSADLQLVLLALLAERPAHGYELIKAIEDRSGGFYSPSPGVIYPALTYLNEIGRAAMEVAGAKKLYSITAEGRAHLDANRPAADAILDEFAAVGARMDGVRRAFAGEDDDGLGPAMAGELREARHALKRALHEYRPRSVEDARRVVAILRRAAGEILGH